jgi:hypothetical protein
MLVMAIGRGLVNLHPGRSAHFLGGHVRGPHSRKSNSRIMLRMSVGGWTFLSNYGHVLVALSTHPDARMRDIADMVGITERAVQQIVRELVDQGYVFKDKDGRRNRYHIAHHAHLRHELEAGVSIGEFVALVRRPVDRARIPRPPKPSNPGLPEPAETADGAPA